ncbi:hypothetical protein D3C81_637540 [compost metagenome]
MVGEEGRHPLRHAQGHETRHCRRLGRAAQPAFHRGWRRPLRFRRGQRRRFVQYGGDLADLPVLVNVAHRHVGVGGVGAQGGRQARGQEGVATEVAEEVQLAQDRLAGEQLGQRREQGRFGRRFRHVRYTRFAGWRCAQRHGLQRFSVDLARGQARHQRQQFKTARHHVRRQVQVQGRAQGFRRQRIGRRLVAADDIRHQLVDAIILAQQDGHRAYACLLRQHGFDLAQLHAEAAYFDLVVGAAQALYLAIGINARQVARAVQARIIGSRAPGIGQEFFHGQVGAAQVALGQAGADDAQLTRLAARQKDERTVFSRLGHLQH